MTKTPPGWPAAEAKSLTNEPLKVSEPQIVAHLPKLSRIQAGCPETNSPLSFPASLIPRLDSHRATEPPTHISRTFSIELLILSEADVRSFESNRHFCDQLKGFFTIHGNGPSCILCCLFLIGRFTKRVPRSTKAEVQF